MFPDDGRESTTLLANADAALYRAKAEGRGVTRFFKLDMDKRLRERHAMRHDLSAALDRGELAMFYQPQATVTGKIVGFEALLRWRHPLRGSVPPSTFIPIAEESALIVRIGEWALRDVCREAASWPHRLASRSICRRCSFSMAICRDWSMRSCSKRASRPTGWNSRSRKAC